MWEKSEKLSLKPGPTGFEPAITRLTIWGLARLDDGPFSTKAQALEEFLVFTIQERPFQIHAFTVQKSKYAQTVTKAIT